MNDYTYKIMTTPLGDAIVRIEDGSGIPKDPNNCDYMAYLAWIEAGNIPEQEFLNMQGANDERKESKR
jgi:hypothetical protein